MNVHTCSGNAMCKEIATKRKPVNDGIWFGKKDFFPQDAEATFNPE